LKTHFPPCLVKHSWSGGLGCGFEVTGPAFLEGNLMQPIPDVSSIYKHFLFLVLLVFILYTGRLLFYKKIDSDDGANKRHFRFGYIYKHYLIYYAI
jgi:hypothetical protein